MAFANVPNLPGVPQIPRSPNFSPAIQSILGLIESNLWGAAFGDSEWAIISPNVDLTSYVDNVLDFDHVNPSKVSNFPVQEAAFAGYNKVRLPEEIRIRVSKGGSINERMVFLTAIRTAKESLDLFDIVTPEETFINMNLYDYSNRRESDEGANLLIVELRFQEIRQVAPQYTQAAITQNAKQPDAAPVVSDGKVQPRASILSQVLK